MCTSQNLPLSWFAFQLLWSQLELRISYLFKMNNEFLSFLCFVLIWKKWLKLLLLLFSFLSHRKQQFSSQLDTFIGLSEQHFVVCLLCKEITHLENNVFDSETAVTNVFFYLHLSPIILHKECAKLSGCLAMFCDVVARFKYSLLNKWNYMQSHHSINWQIIAITSFQFLFYFVYKSIWYFGTAE